MKSGTNQYGSQTWKMQALPQTWGLLFHLYGGQFITACRDGNGMRSNQSKCLSLHDRNMILKYRSYYKRLLKFKDALSYL